MTDRYNTTQLEVSEQRNNAEIEIARINASLDYLKILRKLPEEEIAARHLATAIAAPALPPALAFRLAIEELPQSTSALDTLMAKYGHSANKYLATALEIPFSDLQTITSISSPASASSKVNEANNLLDYLRSNRLRAWGVSTSL